MPPSTLPAPAGFDVLLVVAAALYALHVLADLALPRLRTPVLAAGLLVHLAGIVQRAVAIEFFPLTNKFESFYGFSFAAFAVLFAARRSPSRVHRLGLFAVGAAFYAWATTFDRGLFPPPPLMITPWYPLHVPATFVAYALWTSAATAGLAVLLVGERPELRRVVEGHAFWGFCVFSVSMVFGGAWGYVAWGAYFLWDPKVVWSVILWLYYAGFVHLRYWPGGVPPRGRAALAFAGLAILLVAYVGTSFLFSNSSHSFS